ncbi:hypothetical protein GJ496_007829 [Pomphorhynchus laevis]|nr:hypothetical protein GJ496_007829 [Pomphorhynchus laevis]
MGMLQLMGDNLFPLTGKDNLQHICFDGSTTTFHIDRLRFDRLLVESNNLDKARLRTTDCPKAASWLQITPSISQALNLTPPQFCVLCCMWLGLAILPPNHKCGRCYFDTDLLGFHALTCQYGGHRGLRHDGIRDVIYEAAQFALRNKLLLVFCCSKLVSFNMTSGDEGEISIRELILQQNKLMKMFIKQMEERDDHLKRSSDIDDHPNQQSTQSTAVNDQVSILPFRRFNGESESWRNYLSQTTLYFDACGIKDSQKKKTSLLSWLSPKMFDVVRKATTTLEIDEMAFDEVVEILNKHYSIRVHVISARFNFMSIRKKDKETYNEWVNNLEGASRDCNFFNPTIKDEASAIADRIRDMIAMYSPDEYIRKSALRHEALTLEQLIDITTNYEIMSRAPTNNTQKDDVADTTPQTCNDQDEIYFNRKQKQFGSRIEKYTQRCRNCGNTHTSNQYCPAKGKKCFNCQKAGHFARLCRSKQIRMLHPSKQSGQYEILKIGGRKIVEVQLPINNCMVRMQLDTGAAATMVSKDIWNIIGRPHLRSTRPLCAFGGSQIAVLGECDVNVQW